MFALVLAVLVVALAHAGTDLSGVYPNAPPFDTLTSAVGVGNLVRVQYLLGTDQFSDEDKTRCLKRAARWFGIGRDTPEKLAAFTAVLDSVENPGNLLDIVFVTAARTGSLAIMELMVARPGLVSADARDLAIEAATITQQHASVEFLNTYYEDSEEEELAENVLAPHQ